MRTIIFLCFAVVFCSCDLQTSSTSLLEGFLSVITKCDTNDDRKLDYLEWDNCFNMHDSSTRVYKRLGSTELRFIFDLVDSDRDKFVSLKEYSDFLVNMAQQDSAHQQPMSYETIGLNPEAIKEFEFSQEKARTFSVTNRDGSIKEMAAEDFYELMEERMKNFRSTKNDQLIQEKEETFNMTYLMENQPLASRFVHLGNWSFHFLKHLGHIRPEATLHKIQSLLPKEQRHLSEDELDFSQLAITLSTKQSFNVS